MTAWQDNAACRGLDPTIWFPERYENANEAKAICAGCSVRQDCLNEAVARHERFGVWGGLSTYERRGLTDRPGQRGRAAGVMPIRHGTLNGYKYCLRNPNGPCEVCRDAATRYKHPDPRSPELLGGGGEFTTLAKRLREAC